jgi:spermidine/putrescine transport system substrate-binding protein
VKLLLLVAVCIAASCGRDSGRAPPVIEAYGTKVQRDSLARRLHLFTWPDYIDPKLVSEFEERYDVRVIIDYYDTNEALIAKLGAGGLGQYDVVVASDYAVEVLRHDSLLQELDHALLPNLRNLEPRFRAMPFDSANRYTVTYQWGTSGLGIRTDLVDTTGIQLDSWRLVFDSTAQLGPFVMLADPRETIGAALLYLGHSANSTDPVELAAAELLLRRQRSRLLTYAPFANGRDMLASGDVVVAHNYSGDVLTARQEVPGIHYVIPREGAILWTDNMAIPRRAPGRYTALVFINFILDASVGARLSNFTRYASPNAASFGLIDASLKADPSVYPDSSLALRLEVARDIGMARGLYDRIWTRLRSQ